MIYLKKKYNKYKNHRCQYDGHKFDSKKEMERYKFLKAREEMGLIRDLKLQWPFKLGYKIEGNKLNKKGEKTYREAKYVCDFFYYDCQKDEMIVEDLKSVFTAKDPLFRHKKGIMKKEHGIDVKVVI